MKQVLKAGVVGTSSIMREMLEAIRQTEGLTAQAVYSRSLERGKEFAVQNGVPEACDDYEAMISRTDLDVIYLASPNKFHVPQALEALKHGKYVLVEKPVSVREKDVELLTQTARENGVFFFETITTLFMPNFLAFRQVCSQLKDKRQAIFNFGRKSSKWEEFVNGTVPSSFSPAMEGGALNDMGIYCIHPAVDLFGRPEGVSYEAKLADNGVDIDGKLLLTYPDLICEINTSKSTNIPCGCYVEGSNGWVRQQGLVNSFENCTASLNGSTLDVEHQKGEHRMIYELARFRDAILQRDENFFEKMAKQSQTASWVLEEAHRG